MMHRSRLPSSRLIGLAVVASVWTTACSGGPATVGQGPPPALVQVQTVEPDTVRESSEFVGALEAQERVALRPAASGRITEILVQPGQRVAAGDLLMVLRAEQIQAEVRGAEADVGAARDAEAVAAAQVEAARAELAQADANVDYAQQEYDRKQDLVAQGALPELELDALQRALRAAEAARNAAAENVSVAEARLQQAQSERSRAEADVDSAAADLEDSSVRAPIAGVVGNIPVQVGDYVTPTGSDQPLTSIIQNDSLELNISVPLERTTELRVGLPVELLNAQGEVLTRGEISFVSPEVNTADQAILAKASFPNSSGGLKDGQFVRARIIWQSSPGILVPTAAVTRIAGQTFVYVAEAGEPSASGEPSTIARQRLVELGEIQGNTYQVRSGLEAGDRVITSGILNLTDGAPVTEGQPEQPANQSESPAS